MTVNEQRIEGDWQQVQGKLRERWSQLTDDELGQLEGNTEALIGTIQQKTGEAREAIEKYLEEISAQGPRISGKAAEAARQTARQMSESIRQGYCTAGRVIQDRPGQAVAMAFGAGLLLGGVLGLILGRRD